MRKLDTIQKEYNLNTVYAIDDKGNGNANHEYLVILDSGATLIDNVLYDSDKNVVIDNGMLDLQSLKDGTVKRISFQNGARNFIESSRGVLDTDLLEIVRDRLIGFQSSNFASKYNEEALYHVEKALEFMNERVMERATRNVLGTNNK